ncbi:hypothetical protein Rhopal_007216-T1 [Rhodotorula paludigena]|uniref:Uncharacterized protein n=1 Tax=Rhodotorula paludigena TaxID=86838 RepID=A0AAV5GXC2_9BASI|nr:hypothetical protein Rhopal_007216-T1 [Rhodotorula paludigena]
MLSLGEFAYALRAPTPPSAVPPPLSIPHVRLDPLVVLDKPACKFPNGLSKWLVERFCYQPLANAKSGADSAGANELLEKTVSSEVLEEDKEGKDKGEEGESGSKEDKDTEMEDMSTAKGKEKETSGPGPITAEKKRRALLQKSRPYKDDLAVNDDIEVDFKKALEEGMPPHLVSILVTALYGSARRATKIKLRLGFLPFPLQHVLFDTHPQIVATHLALAIHRGSGGISRRLREERSDGSAPAVEPVTKDTADCYDEGCYLKVGHMSQHAGGISIAATTAASCDVKPFIKDSHQPFGGQLEIVPAKTLGNVPMLETKLPQQYVGSACGRVGTWQHGYEHHRPPKKLGPDAPLQVTAAFAHGDPRMPQPAEEDIMLYDTQLFRLASLPTGKYSTSFILILEDWGVLLEAVSFDPLLDNKVVLTNVSDPLKPYVHRAKDTVTKYVTLCKQLFSANVKRIVVVKFTENNNRFRITLPSSPSFLDNKYLPILNSAAFPFELPKDLKQGPVGEVLIKVDPITGETSVLSAQGKKIEDPNFLPANAKVKLRRFGFFSTLDLYNGKMPGVTLKLLKIKEEDIEVEKMEALRKEMPTAGYQPGSTFMRKPVFGVDGFSVTILALHVPPTLQTDDKLKLTFIASEAANYRSQAVGSDFASWALRYQPVNGEALNFDMEDGACVPAQEEGAVLPH